MVLGVIVKFPFCSWRYFCLPILFRRYINKKTSAKQGTPYRTRPEFAVEMLHVLCQDHEHRRIHAVGDSSYGG